MIFSWKTKYIQYQFKMFVHSIVRLRYNNVLLNLFNRENTLVISSVSKNIHPILSSKNKQNKIKWNLPTK